MNKNRNSFFFGNYYCLIEKYNLAFVAIAKNGVTHLKNIAIHSKDEYWPEKETVHDIIGYQADEKFLYKITDRNFLDKKYDKLKYFAVWRDPVERLISCYKNFILESTVFRNYFHYIGLYENSSFDQFMEFVRFELGKPNPLFQDEHIRRQSDYYQIKDVDVIIPIEKLNLFLAEHNIPLGMKNSNKTTIKFHIENKHYIEEIKELYKSDYALIRSSKLY